MTDITRIGPLPLDDDGDDDEKLSEKAAYFRNWIARQQALNQKESHISDALQREACPDQQSLCAEDNNGYREMQRLAGQLGGRRTLSRWTRGTSGLCSSALVEEWPLQRPMAYTFAQA